MKKNSVIYLLGEVFSKILPFLLIPYFTRALGSEGYGELSLFQVYQNLAIILITLGGDTLLSRAKFRYNDKVFEEIAILVLFCYTIIFLFYLSSALIFKFEIPLYAVISGYFYTLLNVVLVRNQVNERSTNYLIVQLSTNVLITLFTIFIFEYFSASYQQRAIAIVIGIFPVFLYCLIAESIKLRARHFKLRLKIYIYLLISTSIAMFFHKISFFLRGQLDRLIVANGYGLNELSSFALANQLASSIQIMITAVNMAIVPVLYKNLKSNKAHTLQKIHSAIPYLFCLSLLFTLIAYFIPANVYGYLFGVGFEKVGDYLPLFVFGFSIQSVYILLSSTVIYYGRVNKLALATTFSSVLHVSLVIFFSGLGVEYVPLALAISNLFSIVLVYLFSYREIVKNVE